jgi:hypothetical protein
VEQEQRTPPPKLIDILRADYATASEVRVSFPDQWEYIDTIQHEQGPIYLAGFPLERSFTGREHFEGLPPEINVDLVFYRLYKFFQPWSLPQVTVEWNASRGQGRVKDVRGWHLQMQPIGQAQAWFGLNHALLWECYFDESRRVANWQETLREVWKRVEDDLQVPTFLTAPHDPAFPHGYQEFLTRLGYARDVEYPLWWSKQRGTSRRITTSTATHEAPASVSERDDPAN